MDDKIGDLVELEFEEEEQDAVAMVKTIINPKAKR